MTPRRVLIFAVVAAVLYAAFGYWVVTNFEIPTIRGSAWALVVVAVVCQIGAKWFFGMQFRESAEVVGENIPLWPAFKAALVGAGVARLIPVGGAVTPVAMSWTVRDEAEGTAGAAIRATFLNYAGLLIITGLGLLVARPIDDRLAIGSVSLVVLAPFVLIVGLAVMFGSGKLGSPSSTYGQGCSSRRPLCGSCSSHSTSRSMHSRSWRRLAELRSWVVFRVCPVGWESPRAPWPSSSLHTVSRFRRPLHPCWFSESCPTGYRPPSASWPVVPLSSPRKRRVPPSSGVLRATGTVASCLKQ